MDNAEVLQRFGKLPFPIEVELGNLTLTIGEILELSEGTILNGSPQRSAIHFARGRRGARFGGGCSGSEFPFREGAEHVTEAEDRCGREWN
jgi:Type III flagellar switch regulator (C-ring) FliN C-term